MPAPQLDAELNELLDPESPCRNAAPSKVYLRLAAWCEAHDSVPDEVVALVQMLREEEDDSPILDRLAAWVAPSVRGMLDLAGWANGRQGCFDGAWREAAARWKDGSEPTEADKSLLEEVADPEQSWEFEAFQRAALRNKDATFRACEGAMRSPDCRPVWRVILRTWMAKAVAS